MSLFKLWDLRCFFSIQGAVLEATGKVDLEFEDVG